MSESLGDRPAFPHEADYVRGKDPNTYIFQVPFDPGMSIHERFVEAALTGTASISPSIPSNIAERAVRIADAAVALLEKRVQRVGNQKEGRE